MTNSGGAYLLKRIGEPGRTRPDASGLQPAFGSVSRIFQLNGSVRSPPISFSMNVLLFILLTNRSARNAIPCGLRSSRLDCPGRSRSELPRVPDALSKSH
jgi:hypothetical protein